MPANKSVLKFKYGLSTKFTTITPDANSIYFLTDTKQLFVGDVEYTRPVKHGASLPSSYAPENSIFVKETGNEREIYYSKDGASWEKIGLSSSDLKDLENRVGTIEGKVSSWDAKVDSVKAGNKSITIGGTAKAPTVAVAISNDADNDLSLAADGLKVVVPAAAEYSVTKDNEAGEFAAVYHLTKNGTNTGVAINIPKDMVVKSGTVETNPKGQTAGTYLVLVLANATEDKIYIPVDSLIEYVTSGSKTGDMIVVDVSNDHKVTATITDGTITLAKLETGVQTKINQAHTHSNKTILDAINQDKVDAWDAAEQNAKDYADSLNSAMDTRVKALETAKHTHANKTVLDGITSAKVSAWDAKQDALVFNTTYNASTNKVATMADITAAELVWEQF